MDESALHSCVYWRAVGRQVIEEFGLKSLAGMDSFLLSPDDLSAAMGHKGVLEELTMKPHALVAAALFSPWLKPLRAMAAVVSRNANVSHTLSGWAKRISRARGRSVGQQRKQPGPDAKWETPVATEPKVWPKARVNISRGAKRHLMGVLEDTEAEIRLSPFYPYVKTLAANFSAFRLPNASASTVGLAVAQSWLRDAFAWRPASFGGTCAAAEAVVASVGQVALVIKSYYEHFILVNAPQVTSSRLRDVLPTLKATNLTYPGGVSVTSVWST